MQMSLPQEPTRRQISAMSFVILLSPAIRLIPGAAARAAGHAGWLCPAAAAPLCVLTALLVSRAMRGRREGEGLGELLVRRFPRYGRCVLLLYGLWLALYAGFAVRSAASRFIYTIYTGADPWAFVAIGLFTGTLAALGSVPRLARTSELFRVLLLAAIVPILALGLAQLDWGELLPVTGSDLPGLIYGGAEVFGTVAFVLVNVPFLETGPAIERRGRSMGAWSLRACIFLMIVVASVIGCFGPELSGALSYPFFALVRNTGLFGVAERIDALVTGLWVLSDFVLCALALMAASGSLRLALNIRERAAGLPAKPLVTLACAALALACALVIAPDSYTLRLVSDKIVVIANLAAIVVLLMPAIAAVALSHRRA